MSRILAAAVVVALSLLSAPSRAHGPNEPPHQLYQIGDLNSKPARSIRTSRSPT